MQKNLEQTKNEIAGFYTNHKSEFINKFRKDYPTLHYDALIDIFQEAVVIGVEKVNQSKFEGRSSLKTYIFGIGKNLIRDYFRKVKQYNAYSSDIKYTYEESESVFDIENPIDIQSSALKRAMQKLEKHCLDILNAFYMEGKKYPEIVQEFKYSSVDVAKSTKSRCFKHLKMLVSNEITV